MQVRYRAALHPELVFGPVGALSLLVWTLCYIVGWGPHAQPNIWGIGAAKIRVLGESLSMPMAFRERWNCNFFCFFASMYPTILLIHKISVSLFLLAYIVRLIGLLGNIQGLQSLFAKKPVRIVVDMVISTLFLITGMWMLFNMPSGLISTLLIVKIAVVFLSIPIAIVGFKKGKKALAILSVVLLLGAYGMGEANKKRPVIQKDMARTSAEAKELYMAGNCNLCHGAQGNEPNTSLGAKDLSKSKLGDAEIKSIISNGKNNMPGYKKQLDEKQIDELVQYVKTLRANKEGF
jgi:mono/diheme cytochrome c family protein